MRAALAGLVVLSACFGPGLGDEPFVCGAIDPRCPPGYACRTSTNHCVRNGAPMIDAGRVTDGRVTDGPVTDGPIADAPVADAPPPDAARPDASRIDATPCVSHCEGDVAITCPIEGGTVMTSCPAGCDGQVMPAACFLLSPSLLPATTCRANAPAPPTFQPGVQTVDTTQCTGGEIRSQQGAPDMCIFRYSTVMLPVGTTLRVEGTRVAVFVSTGNVVLAGTIDASGNGGTPGAGAIIGAVEQGGNGPAMTAVGGGGGGAATGGGMGGAPINADGGKPGSLHPSEAALRAGGFGGAGGDRCGFAGCPTHGGGGGGGIYIVACGTIQINSAALDVSGGGGDGGEEGNLQQLAGGGDGGGAGGDLVIEASQVTISGDTRMGANGGGGGGGGTRGNDLVPGVAGKPGTDGSPTVIKAAGGAAPSGAGAGGDGGIGSVVQTQLPGGGGPAGDFGSGGGGGGAAGRIRFLTRSDKPVSFPAGIVVSPAASTGTIMRTH